jgi:integrase
VEIWSIDQSRKALEVIKQGKYFRLITPYFALCLFQGLRPFAEAFNASFEDFDWSNNMITVRSKKIHQRRFVPMTAPFMALMETFKDRTGPIIFSGFRDVYESFKADLGFKIGAMNPDGPQWIPDVLRHSFGSYWLALHKNSAELKEIMGTSEEMLRKHYRRPIIETVASEFWSLR